VVVSSPDVDIKVTFDATHTDITSGEKSLTFEVSKGDGRIFISN